MLTQFLLASGWLFWAMVGLIILIDMFLLSTEAEIGAVFVTAVAVLGALLFTDAFKGANPIQLAWLAAAYVAIGIAWSIWKWWSFVKAKRSAAHASYEKADKRSNPDFESYAELWRPDAATNKDRITAWMTLWPFSMLWAVLSWPRRFFAWVYERIRTTFDRITERVWQS